MVFNYVVQLNTWVRILIGLSSLFLVICDGGSGHPENGQPVAKNSTLRLSNKFIPGVVSQENSEAEFPHRSPLDSVIEDTFRKVIFGAINVEFGDSPEWSWVLGYVDTNWAELYSAFESTRVKSQERERIERNLANCLDEVGHANSRFCEDELINHLVKEAALRIVEARTYADDISYVAVGKISMINDQVFEAHTNDGLLAKFFCPLLTLKYFLPSDPAISLTLGVIVGLFIDGDLDKNFSINKREFYVLETKKGDGNLRESDVDEYFNRIDISHDGQLSWFEFLLVPICTMHICFRDLNLPDVGAQPLADQLKAGDLNRDGFLTMAELSASAKGLVLTTEENEDLVDMDDIFDLFDEDQDGRVSFREIDAVFKNIHLEPMSPPPQPQFAPAGQNGALTRDDMAKLAKTVEHRLGQKIDIDAIMMMLDKNGNGVIDKSEQQLISNLLKLV